MHGAQDVSAPAVLTGDGLHLGGAQFDHGELGCDEETVEQDEEQGKQNQAEISEIGGCNVTGGRVHEVFWVTMERSEWGRRAGFSSNHPTIAW